MSKLNTYVIAALCALTPAVAFAGDFDGSRNLSCVPTDLMSCEGPGECERVTAEELNVPEFIHVDFKAKKLSGTLKSGETQNSAVSTVDKADGRTLLQGYESGRGWSMVIMHDTGEMSAAIAGDEAAFVLFGACTGT